MRNKTISTQLVIGLIVIAIVGISKACQGQDCMIMLKDSTQVYTKIIGMGGDRVYTGGANYKFDEIAMMGFDGITEGKESVYSRLEAVGVALSFDVALEYEYTDEGSDGVVVDGVNINELDIEYVEIRGWQIPLSQRYIVQLYYGRKFGMNTNQFIKDTTGKTVRFIGMVDALNFMSKNGWAYIDTYSTPAGNYTITSFLMKKIKN